MLCTRRLHVVQPDSGIFRLKKVMSCLMKIHIFLWEKAKSVYYMQRWFKEKFCEVFKRFRALVWNGMLSFRISTLFLDFCNYFYYLLLLWHSSCLKATGLRPRKSWCFGSSLKVGENWCPRFKAVRQENSLLLMGDTAFMFYSVLQLIGQDPPIREGSLLHSVYRFTR